MADLLFDTRGELLVHEITVIQIQEVEFRRLDVKPRVRVVPNLLAQNREMTSELQISVRVELDNFLEREPLAEGDYFLVERLMVQNSDVLPVFNGDALQDVG